MANDNAPKPLDLEAIKAYTDAATGPRLLVGHKSWAGENAVLTEEGHPVAVFGHGDVAETDSVFFARARADMPELIAALADVRNLHSEFRIFDECGHRHTLAEVDAEEAGAISIGLQNFDSVGLVCEEGYAYSICQECCTGGGREYQTETCAGDHATNRACWPCPTRRAADGEPDA